MRGVTGVINYCSSSYAVFVGVMTIMLADQWGTLRQAWTVPETGLIEQVRFGKPIGVNGHNRMP